MSGFARTAAGERRDILPARDHGVGDLIGWLRDVDDEPRLFGPQRLERASCVPSKVAGMK